MGDELIGWDTDQFPTDLYLTTQIMLGALKWAASPPAASTSTPSAAANRFEPVDLFHAHIGGMDAFARGLKTAAAIRADGRIDEFIKERYKTWDSGIGAEIEAGKTSLADLEKYALANGEPMVASGRQEMIEGLHQRVHLTNESFQPAWPRHAGFFVGGPT